MPPSSGHNLYYKSMEQALDFSAHSPVQAKLITLFKYSVFIPLLHFIFEKYFNHFISNYFGVYLWRLKCMPTVILLDNYIQYILGLCYAPPFKVFIGNVVHDKSNYLVNINIHIILSLNIIRR